MARKFKTIDYEQSGQQTLTIDDCLPAEHLARFIVAILGMLDLSVFYAHYAAVGGEPIDPKMLLAPLLYAYATGVFSSRKIEQATYEIIPFRFIAGGLHPDHSTIAEFRKTFLAARRAGDRNRDCFPAGAADQLGGGEASLGSTSRRTLSGRVG